MKQTFAGLRYLQNLKYLKLDLSANKIGGEETMEVLSSSIANLSNLEELILPLKDNENLSKKGAICIAKALS